MSDKKKLVLIIALAAALVAVLVGAYFGYKALSDGRSPESPSPSAKADEAAEKPETEETAPPVKTEKPKAEETAPPVKTEEPAEEKPLAPDFTVYDADGNAVALSDNKGTPVVVNFWATWCGPCQDEMPLMQEAYKEYGDRAAFMFVNLTDGTYDTVESVGEFMERYGYDLPVFFDSDASGAEAYGVTGIPFTVFIDRDGAVAGSHLGSISEESLRDGLDAIL